MMQCVEHKAGLARCVLAGLARCVLAGPARCVLAGPARCSLAGLARCVSWSSKVCVSWSSKVCVSWSSKVLVSWSSKLRVKYKLCTLLDQLCIFCIKGVKVLCSKCSIGRGFGGGKCQESCSSTWFQLLSCLGASKSCYRGAHF